MNPQKAVAAALAAALLLLAQPPPRASASPQQQRGTTQRDGGFGAEIYVEQLDADGDGVGEVFTLSRSFEGTTYRDYRRRRGVWRAAYENYSYRCAY